WGAINGRSPATICRLPSTAHTDYIRTQRDRLPTHVEYFTQQLDSGTQRFCQPGNDDVVSRLPNGPTNWPEMISGRRRCLHTGPIGRRYGDGLAADRHTTGVGRRPPGIVGEREGAHPRPRCAGRTAPADAEG